MSGEHRQSFPPKTLGPSCVGRPGRSGRSQSCHLLGALTSGRPRDPASRCTPNMSGVAGRLDWRLRRPKRGWLVDGHGSKSAKGIPPHVAVPVLNSEDRDGDAKKIHSSTDWRGLKTLNPLSTARAHSPWINWVISLCTSKFST